MVNVSYIIGAGIFVGPALTLQLVGSGGMNLILWTIGAFVALSGTYTFMELGTMVKKLLFYFSIQFIILTKTTNSFPEGIYIYTRKLINIVNVIHAKKTY